MRGRYARELEGTERTVFYLVRHGETDWNVEKRIQGKSDIPLNERGLEQSRRTGKRFEKVPLDRIYSSDLKRARQTAEAIAAATGAPVVLREDLRERNWGALEGMTWDEISEKRPRDMNSVVDGGMNFAPEGGESKVQAMNRVVKAFFDIADGNRNKSVAVTLHGGVSALLVKRLLGLQPGSRTPFALNNCGVTRVEVYPNDVFLIAYLNDVSHLDGVV